MFVWHIPRHQALAAELLKQLETVSQSVKEFCDPVLLQKYLLLSIPLAHGIALRLTDVASPSAVQGGSQYNEQHCSVYMLNLQDDGKPSWRQTTLASPQSQEFPQTALQV